MCGVGEWVYVGVCGLVGAFVYVCVVGECVYVGVCGRVCVM